MKLEQAQQIAQEAKDKNPSVTNLIIERRYSVLGRTYIDYAVVDKSAYDRVIAKKQDFVTITIYQEV
jgi:hypothetical protein